MEVQFAVLFVVQGVSPYWHCRLVCWLFYLARLFIYHVEQMNCQNQPARFSGSVSADGTRLYKSLPHRNGGDGSDGNWFTNH